MKFEKEFITHKQKGCFGDKVTQRFRGFEGLPDILALEPVSDSNETLTVSEVSHKVL